MNIRIFGYEPVVVLNALSAILGLVVSLGFSSLTPDQAGAIVGIVTAILGAVAAAMTRPVAPQAFTTLVAAGATLVATFGYDVSAGTTSAINTAALAILTLLTRGQVSPLASLRRPAKPTAV